MKAQQRQQVGVIDGFVHKTGHLTKKARDGAPSKAHCLLRMIKDRLRIHSSDIGYLEVLPGGAVIEADLTEDLIFLRRAGFGERLAEEIALVGNVLFNGADAGDVSAQQHAGGHKAVEHNAQRAEIGLNECQIHAAGRSINGEFRSIRYPYG